MAWMYGQYQQQTGRTGGRGNTVDSFAYQNGVGQPERAAPKKLYYMDLSALCRSVKMVADEIGINLDIHPIDVFGGEQKQDWYCQINPHHTVPTLKDGDMVLWESRTIMRYLINAYAPDSSLYPKDPQARARVDLALDADYGSYYKTIIEWARPQLFGAEAADVKPVHEVLGIIERTTPIKDGKFICGDSVTIADFAVFTTVTFLELVQCKCIEEKFPKVLAWINKMKSRRTVQEVNKGFETAKRDMAEKMGKKN